jgi:hypothetical protein
MVALTSKLFAHLSLLYNQHPVSFENPTASPRSSDLPEPCVSKGKRIDVSVLGTLWFSKREVLVRVEGSGEGRAWEGGHARQYVG